MTNTFLVMSMKNKVNHLKHGRISNIITRSTVKVPILFKKLNYDGRKLPQLENSEQYLVFGKNSSLGK